eukprot:TRINITY_DN94244_c0_g1_i1.p1 TRINITY_DN94244_c0_g1~~TRINITY_DN94244_c0_g1_i1.p1  ORF type:complete len:350 (+),score=32.34 TRINITY_DN94244_c0_g1_i1:29-1051(+)
MSSWKSVHPRSILLLLFLCCVGVAARDSCAAWIIDVFAGKWCDKRARDVTHQLLEASKPPLSDEAPISYFSDCDCTANAFTVQYFFSMQFKSLAQSNKKPSNITVHDFNWWNYLSSLSNIWSPTFSTNLTVPCPLLVDYKAMASRVTQMRCALGLPPCSDDDAQKLVQFSWDAPVIGFTYSHTAVLQFAAKDEYYVWQGWQGEFDLWTWVNQKQAANRNFTFANPFAGKALNKSEIITWMDLFEDFVLGKYNVSSTEYEEQWKLLWWTPPPTRVTLPKCLNNNGGIGVQFAFITSSYEKDICHFNMQLAEHVVWDATWEMYRQEMCGMPGGRRIAPCPQS